ATAPSIFKPHWTQPQPLPSVSVFCSSMTILRERFVWPQAQHFWGYLIAALLPARVAARDPSLGKIPVVNQRRAPPTPPRSVPSPAQRAETCSARPSVSPPPGRRHRKAR